MRFMVHCSGDHRGFKKFTVGAEERALSGIYLDGKPYGPDRTETVAGLPYRWRKAATSALSWWYREPRGKEGHVFTLNVYSARGKNITTLYAIPCEEKAGYTVNSWDVCTQGFERLRSRTEFMITLPVRRATGWKEIRDEMKADIQRYAQPDDFDYAACQLAVDEFCAELRKRHKSGKPFMDTLASDETECELFVYMTGPGYADAESE